MQILIRLLNGKTFPLEVGASDTVSSVKEKIKEKMQEENGYSPDIIRLIFNETDVRK